MVQHQQPRVWIHMGVAQISLCTDPTDVSILLLRDRCQPLTVDTILLLGTNINDGFVGAILVVKYTYQKKENTLRVRILECKTKWLFDLLTDFFL